MTTQLPDTIDIYSYGDTGLRVVVEYALMETRNKPSNKYFAFSNPRLNMIKSGAWEIDIYPHYPKEYGTPKPDEILYTFYICFEGNILTCQIIDKPDTIIEDQIANKKRLLPATRFIFITPKTTPIRLNETALIYDQEANPKPNYRRKITKPVTRLEKRIVSFFAKDKIFYADNETGEVLRNYLLWCKN